MSISGIAEWFRALPLLTQIFFGLFLLLVALPFAILIVAQFIETLRGLIGSEGGQRNGDEDEQ